MKKKIFSKITLASIVTATLIFSGCTDTKTESKDTVKKEIDPKIEEVAKQVEKAINEKPKKETSSESKKDKKPLVYTKYDFIVSEVFKDTAKVAPNGKQMILIFGTNTDPFTDRLKADIASSKELQNRFKNDFSSYYFRAYENLKHKQFHEGQFMDVDTRTMIMVYGIEATPTIIFTDDAGKAVLVVPGYIPAKQFLVTMDFMQSGKWKGKDRKNGEVYEALRDFYTKNGINVTKRGE